LTDPVLVTRHDSVTVITLNRPDRLNAFNGAVLDGLMQAFLACRDDDACRAVIVTGAGRGFCAGQDLTAREIAVTGDRPDLGAGLESAYNPLILLMRDMDKPIISAVNGIAVGAGANFALAADFVVAARSAAFLQAFARIGLIPDAGGTWWLTHHLGEPRAKALAMLAEPLPAEQAAEWGLIHKVVDDDKLMEEAQGLARRLAAGPTRAYALTKRAIHAASRNALETQLVLERELQREAGYSDDFIEGVSAFLEKRPAKFSGR
jgi:2-(1,2-epoxy-1,2-dihydrophenyl)acetyl-CoA isomerase